MPTHAILDPTRSPLEELAESLKTDWPRIFAAKHKALDKISELNDALAGETSPDTSIVLYGSLAREEFTEGSDLDWTLLVDGQANPQHQKDLIDIRLKLDRLGKPPGREKTFGKLIFSHPVLHMIGGEDDTNANTTRRVLFLLEATAIGHHKEAFERVRKNILHRYLTEDHGLNRQVEDGGGRWIPLFLLNDMARYWRTMTVDFAYKQWDRGNEGYALRSLKLGVSRKLIYASGLLTCFWCDPFISRNAPRGEMRSPAEKTYLLNQKLSAMLMLTPLERFAWFFLTHASNQFLISLVNGFFSIYDDFLGLLGDKDVRSHLDSIPPSEMDRDPVFQSARAVRTRFERVILGIFLNPESPLYQHTISRGVF